MSSANTMNTAIQEPSFSATSHTACGTSPRLATAPYTSVLATSAMTSDWAASRGPTTLPGAWAETTRAATRGTVRQGSTTAR